MNTGFGNVLRNVDGNKVRSLVGAWLIALPVSAQAQWQIVYQQDFDTLKAGQRTGEAPLHQWKGGESQGVVRDGGKGSSSGKYLASSRDWQARRSGPVLNLDLARHPHDRVRVRMQMYTFGDWRGLQSSTRGPQHRLLFADVKSKPSFVFDTNFSTNRSFEQSWPQAYPLRNRGGVGATSDPSIDVSRPFANAHAWLLEFDYQSDADDFEFSVCSAWDCRRGTPHARVLH